MVYYVFRRLQWLVILLVLSACFFTSCVPENRIYLFNDLAPHIDTIQAQKSEARRTIRPGDRLSITVGCSDPAQTQFLNPFSNTSTGSANNNNSNGYLVDSSGSISFPLLGRVKIGGLTSFAAADTLRNGLGRFFRDPYVYVSLSGRVFMLDGRGGSVVPIINERITILEALTQSTLQQPDDRKDKVWVIREENNTREYGQINLNKRDMFESPYFYLRNNDMVYIPPGKTSSQWRAAGAFRSIIAYVIGIAALVVAIAK